MKKILLGLAALLIAGGAYAQTQRLNRTNTRTHDRSTVVDPAKASDQTTQNRDAKSTNENDLDRNNTNNSTNKATPHGTGTMHRNQSTNTSTNGVNTNGGTGTNGSNINSNNPR